MDIFTLPVREERIKNLSKGVLAWLHVSKKEYRYDPDNYILTQVFRNVMKASFLVSLLVLGLVVSGKSSNTLFYGYREYLSILGPITIAIPIYYFQLYKKNVDSVKYNPLIIRETGEPIPNTFLSFFILPLSLAVMLVPSYFAYYVYDTETLSYLETFYDSFIFLYLTMSIWVLINSAMAFLCILSLIMIARITNQYVTDKDRGTDE